MKKLLLPIALCFIMGSGAIAQQVKTDSARTKKEHKMHKKDKHHRADTTGYSTDTTSNGSK